MDKRDPMLQKMISPERRAEEIRLLNEYVAAGKVTKIDYVPPEDAYDPTPEELVLELEEAIKEFNVGREQIGDGNYVKNTRTEG